MKYFFALFFFCFCNVLSAQNYSKEIGSLLNQLDSVIAEKNTYIQQKELKIEQLREQKKTSHTMEEVFFLNKMLYDEYSIYKADSAMVYVEDNLRIARKLHKEQWLVEWTIKKSFLLSATGFLTKAFIEMQNISPQNLPDEMKIKYYGQMLFINNQILEISKDESIDIINEYSRLTQLYKDSIDAIITPDEPLYLWYKGWHVLGTDQEESVKNKLEQKVQLSKWDTRNDAMNAYVLSKLCNKKNDRLKYLILSAIADVRSLNMATASLEELAINLCKQGDIDRAYNYINYCLKGVQLYRNRIRMLMVFKIQDNIHHAFQEKQKKQEARLHFYFVIMSILLIILSMSFLYILKQMKSLSLSQKRLNEVNQLMNEHVEQLSDAHTKLESVNIELQSVNEQLINANNKLQKSNNVKEEYIGYVFSICSNYISKMDGFRKDINRKVKANKFDEVRNLTGTQTMTQKELKDFYHNFDMIFLHVYPDFVSDFNALLRPEEHIILKEGELLNTELRIYALVRLGINDSVRIAEFLHCSPQTIYNNRLKVRNKAIIPKEQFVEVVKSLGKMDM